MEIFREMKYLKLFEVYFDEEFKKLNDIDSKDDFLKKIKLEVDQYMYSITDEYQINSSEDRINFLDNSCLITYRNITFNDNFWDDIKKLQKVLYKVFKAKSIIDVVDLHNNRRTYGVDSLRHSASIKRLIPEKFTLDIVVSIPI